MTSEEPGMSVSAAATSPPVQDSAGATVTLRIRQRSSSERDKARESLPLMLVPRTVVAPGHIAPRQANGGAGRSRTGFFAPGTPQPLAVGSLDRHTRQMDSANLGDPSPHGIPVWTDLGPLADQRHLEIGNASASRGDPIDCIFQEFVRGGAFPLHIARRKMRSDIAVRQRAENRIHKRMQSYV